MFQLWKFYFQGELVLDERDAEGVLTEVKSQMVTCTETGWSDYKLPCVAVPGLLYSIFSPLFSFNGSSPSFVIFHIFGVSTINLEK